VVLELENVSETSQPVSLAIAGAGNRGGRYAEWAEAHPDRARVVAVADPRDFQRETMAERHGIPPERTFRSWEELADAGRHGYHLLVEKPLAPTEWGCRAITDAVGEAGVMLAVGHVMRYTPYTRLLMEVLASGRIGEIMSIQHLEPVGYWHQAHSYVRGNWRREDQSSPMLLAKSCHDIDWMRHVVGQPIERVSSFGTLSHFRPENQPAGAADRCLDCAVEPDCAYSAKRLYLDRLLGSGHTGWPLHVITDDFTEEGVTRALREGPYGRCVYACDNDVVDHQVVALEFAGGVTGTFTMTAFSPLGHRRTQIFGTQGSIDGDGQFISVTEFRTDDTEVLNAHVGGADAASGHGGGDAGLMDAFTRAVATGDPAHISSGPQESLATHLAVFAAERARHAGTVEHVA
jgi:predicted dehydrogenase